MTINMPAYRVMVWNVDAMQWRVLSTHDSYITAVKDATVLLWQSKRVRIQPYKKRAPLKIKPPNNTQSRKHRDYAAYQMSDLADAKKHYKSPG